MNYFNLIIQFLKRLNKMIKGHTRKVIYSTHQVYQTFINTLLDKQTTQPHPRDLLFLFSSHVDPMLLKSFTTSYLSHWKQTLQESFKKAIIPINIYAHEANKLCHLFNLKKPHFELNDKRLLELLDRHLYKLNRVKLDLSRSRKIDFSHRDFSAFLEINTMCWSSMTLYQHFLNRSSSYFLEALQKLHYQNQTVYSHIINHYDRYQSAFPQSSARTITLAEKLKQDVLNSHLDIIMIGVAELTSGQILASFSGASASKAHLDLQKVCHAHPDIHLALPTPYTTPFRRFIRIKENGVKFHNGFSCVEPKLFQSASLIKDPIQHLSVLRVSETGKRYDHDHYPTLSKACPGCLLNRNAFEIFH